MNPQQPRTCSILASPPASCPYSGPGMYPNFPSDHFGVYFAGKASRCLLVSLRRFCHIDPCFWLLFFLLCGVDLSLRSLSPCFPCLACLVVCWIERSYLSQLRMQYVPLSTSQGLQNDALALPVPLQHHPHVSLLVQDLLSVSSDTRKPAISFGTAPCSTTSATPRRIEAVCWEQNNLPQSGVSSNTREKFPPRVLHSLSSSWTRFFLVDVHLSWDTCPLFDIHSRTWNIPWEDVLRGRIGGTTGKV
mmetsp:Transcript_10597/g.65337  ORF Transcript_10597/g.65337 Transcript_10597/m.65337 type:complete len:247 (+) Transcript_10597:4349-5089(+)